MPAPPRLNALIAMAVLLVTQQADAQDNNARPAAVQRGVEVMLLSINTQAIHVIVNGAVIETIAFQTFKEAQTNDPNIRQWPLLSSVLQRLYDDGWHIDDSATAVGMPLLYVLTRELK